MNRVCRECEGMMPPDAKPRALYCCDLCRRTAAKWRPGKADRTGPDRAGSRRTEHDLLREVMAKLGELKRAGLIEDFIHIAPKGSHRASRSVERGFPDLPIAVRPGCILLVELKAPDGSGVLSPAQEVWLRCAGRSGVVATEWRDVAELLEDHGVCCDLAPPAKSPRKTKAR